MIARSWNSRIAKAERPCRAVSSPRSASTCRISAVEDSDSANAITSAAGHGWPSARMTSRQHRGRDRDLRGTRAEDRVAHHPEP